jgi:hypothetical protein
MTAQIRVSVRVIDGEDLGLDKVKRCAGLVGEQRSSHFIKTTEDVISRKSPVVRNVPDTSAEKQKHTKDEAAALDA